jgi:hypothetical protein
LVAGGRSQRPVNRCSTSGGRSLSEAWRPQRPTPLAQVRRAGQGRDVAAEHPQGGTASPRKDHVKRQRQEPRGRFGSPTDRGGLVRWTLRAPGCCGQCWRSNWPVRESSSRRPRCWPYRRGDHSPLAAVSVLGRRYLAGRFSGVQAWPVWGVHRGARSPGVHHGGRCRLPRVTLDFSDWQPFGLCFASAGGVCN